MSTVPPGRHEVVSQGERCFKPSCAIEKRNFQPGQHGHARRAKIVGYGLQLREKQKVKRIYGILENQFRTYFEKAAKAQGNHGRKSARPARTAPG
jgi:small subunit ribosomal protein S4